MKRLFVSLVPLCALACVLAVASGQSDERTDPPAGQASVAAKGELAKQAYTLLKESCAGCHSGAKPKAGLKVLDRQSLLDKAQDDPDQRRVVPGEPDKSLLWEKVESDEMPAKPAGQEKKDLSQKQKALLKQWIAAGAPFPEAGTSKKGEAPDTGVPAGEPSKPTAPPAPPADTPPDKAAGAGKPAGGDKGLAERALTILDAKCHECHGRQDKGHGLNVRDRETLLGAASAAEPAAKRLVPGNLEASLLWKFVQGNRMPPAPREPLGPDEKEVLSQWIKAGAPFPVTSTARRFISERELLDLIHADLYQMALKDSRRAQRQRYFSLANLYNNEKVTDRDLNLYRAALSKLINSLSREVEIVRLEADPRRILFRVDLQRLGWTTLLWADILSAYPYGLSPAADDREVRVRYDEIMRLLQPTALHPYVRADWFVANASKPPLYHTILKIPDTSSELERELGVNIARNVAEGNVIRSGFAESAVGYHNRLIERHDSNRRFGYWKSYDFAKGVSRGNLFRFPLGPRFDDEKLREFKRLEKFQNHAFEQAGNEIVFALPNGMPGYMITNKDGKRLDSAPIEVVRDREEIAGTTAVTTGLSCMGCHNHGLKAGLKDTVLSASAIANPEVVADLERLYDADAMQAALSRDQDRILGSFAEAMGYRPKPEDPEPISTLVRLHDRDLGLDEVASELGKKSDELRIGIAHNPALTELGLRPLIKGAKIKRSVWEARESGSSHLMQEAARAIDGRIPKT